MSSSSSSLSAYATRNTVLAAAGAVALASAAAAILLTAGPRSASAKPRTADSSKPSKRAAKQRTPKSSSAPSTNTQDSDASDVEAARPSSSGPADPLSTPSRPRSLKPSSTTPPPVLVVWDVDNCAPPTGSSGRAIVQAIRRAVQSCGPNSVRGPGDSGDEVLQPSGPIVSFKAYLEMSDASAAPSSAQVLLRSELQGCGVSLIDTPKSGRKDVADKMLITDMLAFAIDQPPPARIVLISGDRDMAYPLGCLRNRSYSVLLIVPPVGAPPILEASANVVLKWRQDVLGIETDGMGRPYANMNSSTGSPIKRPVALPATNNTRTAAVTTAAAQAAAVSVPAAPQPTPSGPRTRSEAALRGPGAPPIPPLFLPLIRVLEKLRVNGNPKPLRTLVALTLTAEDRSIYERAGASRWADYAAVAQAAGLITLGSAGFPGSEWVALRSVADPPSEGTKGKAAAPAASTIPPPSTNGAFETPTKAVAAAAAAQEESEAVSSDSAFARSSSPLKRTGSPVKKGGPAAAVVAGAGAAMLATQKGSFNKKNKSDIPYALRDGFQPHSPSNEMIHLSFFCLANFLLNHHRKEKAAYALDKDIRAYVLLHKPKLESMFRTDAAWLSHLTKARDADVIQMLGADDEEVLPKDAEIVLGQAKVRIHPRLNPRGFPAVLSRKKRAKLLAAQLAAQNNSAAPLVQANEASSSDGSESGDASSDAADDNEDTEHILVPASASSTSMSAPAAINGMSKVAVPVTPPSAPRSAINTLSTSPTAPPPAQLFPSSSSNITSAPAAAAPLDAAAERALFKPLVDAVVKLRVAAPLTDGSTGAQVEAQIASSLPIPAPLAIRAQAMGAWYAQRGFKGFNEYAQQGERRGFVVLGNRDEEGAYKRIWLSTKYERMFFGVQEERK